MSKTKYPRAAALAVAKEMCDHLRPVTDRLIVAGSLRRRKDQVGDVEILFIPVIDRVQDPEELLPKILMLNMVDLVLGILLSKKIISKRLTAAGCETWGQKNKLAIHVASGIPVDFFAATEPNWFNYLVCRTGSAENNMAIAKAAQDRGWKWHPYATGFTDVYGDLVKVETERAAFELIGLHFKEPWER